MPRSRTSTASTISASSPGSSGWPCSAHSARTVAVTIALEPARPTSRGTLVPQRTLHGPRAKRAIAASTSALGGSLVAWVACSARAQALSSVTQQASTAPLNPSDGLPANAARAWALPLAIEQRAGADPQRGAELGMAERVLHERRAVAGDGADVEALLAGPQAHPDHAVERCERVGELDLAARGRRGVAQRVDEGRRGEVASGDRQAAGRSVRSGLLDDAGDGEGVALARGRNDPISLDVGRSDLLHRDRRARSCLDRRRQALEHPRRRAAPEQRVAQRDGERSVELRRRAQDRVAEPQRPRLLDADDLGAGGGLELRLEPRAPAAGHQHDALDAAGGELV